MQKRTPLSLFLLDLCLPAWWCLGVHTSHSIHLPTADSSEQIPAVHRRMEPVSNDKLPDKYETKDRQVSHLSLSDADSTPATLCSRCPLPNCFVRMFIFSSRFRLPYCTDMAEHRSILMWFKVSLQSARRDYFCTCTGSHAFTP